MAAIVRAVWHGGPARYAGDSVRLMAGTRVLYTAARLAYLARPQQVGTGGRKGNTKQDENRGCVIPCPSQRRQSRPHAAELPGYQLDGRQSLYNVRDLLWAHVEVR
jgi:hypothetical protein